MRRYLLILLLVIICGCSQNKEIVKTSTENSILENIIQDKLEPLGNDWFLVTASIEIANISPEEARDKAIEKASKRALEYFGVEVGSRTLSFKAETNNKINVDHFSNLIKLTSSGIILKKEIVESKTEVHGEDIYEIVVMKILLGKQKGERDPYFKLNADLNKNYYVENENIEIEITPSIDCYLTVIFISSDESVGTVFPNKYSPNNFAEAGQKLTLPTEKEKSMGIKYKVTLLPNKDEDTELVKVIATKKPISINLNDNFNTALESLQNWLVEIPSNEIVEVDLQYFIKK
ncbi:MAG: DUF4384 domain-containing protein [Candidatus Stygibacter australis]|nr:DUF4384 domain-containing protein [Candidatus Stygibacter australis]MDP8321174.1 DUF4384 domain-containing protein [Candidatus Stygibacter australis]